MKEPDYSKPLFGENWDSLNDHDIEILGEYALDGENGSKTYVFVEIHKQKITEKIVQWQQRPPANADRDDEIKSAIENGVLAAVDFLRATEKDFPAVTVVVRELKTDGACDCSALTTAGAMATLVALGRGHRAVVADHEKIGWQTHFLYA
jgi:hypothetical protein